jgi:predicted GTPase
VGTITETFKKYPGIGVLLPAMGYGAKQVKDLETTINKVPCDVVVIGTPIDLTRLVHIKKPTVRVRYELQEIGTPDLLQVLVERGFDRLGPGKKPGVTRSARSAPGRSAGAAARRRT